MTRFLGGPQQRGQVYCPAAANAASGPDAPAWILTPGRGHFWRCSVAGFGVDMRDEQLRVAMSDPRKLKQWFIDSGRPFVVLHAGDLVDALEWPDGVRTVQLLVSAYRDHRRTLPTGWVEDLTVPDHTTGKSVKVVAPIMRDEGLSLEECDLLMAMAARMRDEVVAELRAKKARQIP